MGAGTVKAAHEGGAEDVVPFVVVPGALARVEVETAGGRVVEARVLNTDESLELRAVGYDADGNVLGLAEATWVVSGGIGALRGRFFTHN